MDPALSKREWAGLALAALAFTVAAYLTPPTLFDTIDWTRIHVFYKQHLHDALRAGRLPLWNPYVALGRPFLADVDAAVFYPPHLLYGLLEIHVACVVITAGHVLLAAAGGTLLARALGVSRPVSLAVAFIFVASAPEISCFQNGLIHYGAALAYLPLVLYLGVRLQDAPSVARVAQLALALGLQLLCGHPQAAWVTGLGLATFVFARRLERPLRLSVPRALGDLLLIGAAVLAAVAVAGVQVLPLAELMQWSNRQTPSIAFSASFAMVPSAWATLVVPSQIGFPVLSSAQLYVGTATLVAGMAGLTQVGDRNVRALLAMAALGALVAAGSTTPAFAALYHVLPGLSAMRLHSRSSVLVVMAVVLGAGLLLSRPRARRDLWWVVGLTVAGLLASLTFIRHWPGSAPAIERILLFATAAALLIAFRRSPRAILPLLALHAAADLSLSAARLKRLYHEPAAFAFEPALRAEIAGAGLFDAAGVPPRIGVLPPIARENAGMRDGWSGYDGYVALHLNRTWTAIHGELGVPAPRDQNAYLDPALARFGPLPLRNMNLVMGVDRRNRRLVLNPAPDPRAYVVGAAVEVKSWQEAITRIGAGHDGHAVALIEAPLATPLPATARQDSKATIRSFRPETIVVDAQSSGPGLLVLAEAFYPGWTAVVNGREIPCVPANGWMRAVPVPGGVSEVTFRFRCNRLIAGALLSLLASGAVIAAMVAGRRKRVTPPPPP